jgi:hypothetical protein
MTKKEIRVNPAKGVRMDILWNLGFGILGWFLETQPKLSNITNPSCKAGLIDV